jgi:hypothetical protein
MTKAAELTKPPARARSARVARTSRRSRTPKGQEAVVADATEAAAPKSEASTVKAPREGSHLAAIVGLLRRPEGASIDAMVQATGWQRHSVRGALAGALKKTYGLSITSTVEEGGRVYRIIEAAA